MKVRDLYAARPLESQPQHHAPDYRKLYQQTVEAIAEDCWSLDPAWLLDHPEQWKSVKTLDDRLTTMERVGASEHDYRATLARLVKCIQDARAAYEKEQAGEKIGEEAEVIE